MLTTQLYFPADKEENERDGIYDKRCLLRVTDKDKDKLGEFDFVLRP